MSRSRAIQALPLLLGLAAAGCNQVGELLLVAEVDLTYSFESGLEGWHPDGVDLSGPGVTWSVDTSGEVSSVGSGAARFMLDNASGDGKIWLEQQFSLTPGQTYDVGITFDLASAESGSPWRVIAGAHDAPPTSAAELVVQDATSPGTGYEWTERSYTVRATSGEQGLMVVVLGLWGTSEDSRTYYLDNVHLVFTRTG